MTDRAPRARAAMIGGDVAPAGPELPRMVTWRGGSLFPTARSRGCRSPARP